MTIEIEIHDQLLSDGSKVYNVDLIEHYRPHSADVTRISLPALDTDHATDLAIALQKAIREHTPMVNFGVEIFDHTRS